MKKSFIFCLLFVMTVPAGIAQINFVEHTVAENFYAAQDVFVIDLDGDGDNDIIGAAPAPEANRICWWENDGDENWTEHAIVENFDGPRCVYAADIDSDGDIDVLGSAARAQSIRWWENGGEENFTQHIIDSDFVFVIGVMAIDLDRDDDVDILAAGETSQDVAWYENDGNENFTKILISDDTNGAHWVDAADMDGDDDIDVLCAACFEGFKWFENDGEENFTEHFFGEPRAGAYGICAGDIDNDGDNDVVGAAAWDDDVIWWENDGNQQPVFSEHEIAGDFTDAWRVFLTDIDSDGDTDVLGAAALGGNKISAWLNDGEENFFELIIDDDYSEPRSIYAADVDGDGHMDVVAASQEDNSISWFENEGLPDLDLTVLPIGDPVYPYMGLVPFGATLTNNTDLDIIYDAWINVIYPNGWICEDPSLIRYGLEILAGETREWDLHLCSPECAEEGQYTFVGFVGEWPEGEIDVEYFHFEIVEVDGLTRHNETDWIIYGLDDDLETNIDLNSPIPNNLTVSKPYPNPFNPTTTITISLPEASPLQLSIYNILGQQVEVVVNNTLDAGYHDFIFDGTHLSSGIYFIQVNVPGKLNEIRKVVLMK